MFNTTTLSTAESGVVILKDFITFIAILIGGIWTYMLYIKQRLKYPRANVAYNITHKPLRDNKILLHVRISITNIGAVLLSLCSVEMRIQQILPLSKTMEENINAGHSLYIGNTAEIDWPIIAEKELRWDNEKCEIEPNERDEFLFDFIIDKNVKTILVYSYIENIKKKKIGWPLTITYELHNTEGSKLVKKEG